MGGVRILGPTTLLTDGVMAGVATIYSGPMDLLSLPYGALEASWSGDPTGSFVVEGSIDGSTFYDTGTATTDPAGVAGGAMINFGFPIGFRYMRLAYTNVSGNGLLQVRGMAKSGGGS